MHIPGLTLLPSGMPVLPPAFFDDTATTESNVWSATKIDTEITGAAGMSDLIDDLTPHLKSSGFAIEVEMITKMARLGYKIYSVPITYDKRKGHSKLSPIIDGLKIIWMMFKNMTWKPEKSTI